MCVYYFNVFIYSLYIYNLFLSFLLESCESFINFILLLLYQITISSNLLPFTKILKKFSLYILFLYHFIFSFIIKNKFNSI